MSRAYMALDGIASVAAFVCVVLGVFTVNIELLILGFVFWLLSEAWAGRWKR
jgi:xanthine/uracil/vitamin C permease (AzgA family)